MGKLIVVIVAARNLSNVQIVGTLDPFCKVKLEEKKERTHVEKGLNPVWNEKFTFFVSDENTSQVIVKVMNKNLLTDEFLGEYCLSLSGLVKGVTKDQWYLLKKCKGNPEIRIQVTALDFGSEPISPQPYVPLCAPVAPVPLELTPPQEPPAAPQEPPAAPQEPPAAPQEPPAVVANPAQVNFLHPNQVPLIPNIVRPPATISIAEEKPWDAYNMTSEEYNHICTVFVFFDQDDSNQLSSWEVAQLLHYLNYARTEKEVTAMFASMDRDRNGQISKAELLTWMKYNAPDPVALYSLSREEYHRALFQFHKQDKDFDGYLKQEEFVKMLVDYLGEDRDRAAVIFFSVDVDDNDRVDLHEYLLYRRRSAEQVRR